MSHPQQMATPEARCSQNQHRCSLRASFSPTLDVSWTEIEEDQLHLHGNIQLASSTRNPEASAISPIMTNSDVGKRVMIERSHKMVSEEIQKPTGLAIAKKKQGENNNKYALSLPHGLPRRNNQSTNKKQDPKSVPFDT